MLLGFFTVKMICPTENRGSFAPGVLDRCARRCIDWVMADTLATTLPLAGLDMPM
jgi:hypothetical protein